MENRTTMLADGTRFAPVVIPSMPGFPFLIFSLSETKRNYLPVDFLWLSDENLKVSKFDENP